MTETLIARRPPCDGREWHAQCARCDSSVDFERCRDCDGSGFAEWETDDENDIAPCEICNGEGSWPMCLSSAAWCQAHPRPGRENVERGEVEWYVVDDRRA
jgi:hypothetical protein